MGLPELCPILPEALMQFLIHLDNAGLAAHSLTVYVATISFWSRSLGLADPAKDFWVRKMLEELRRSSPCKPDKQKPLPCPVLCLSSYEAALFEAILSLMFLGAFHPGDLLCSSHFDTSDRAMMLENVEPQDKKVDLHLRKSKTDQRAKGTFIPLSRSTDNTICPVRLLQAFLQFRGEEAGLLLIYADGSPLTLSQFCLVFNRPYDARFVP